MALGRPLVWAALRKAASTASWSWPLMSWAYQPNASQRGAVGLGPVRVLRVVAEDAAEMEGHGDLDGRQRAGRVARAGGRRAGNDVLADRFCLRLEVGERGGTWHGAASGAVSGSLPLGDIG